MWLSLLRNVNKGVFQFIKTLKDIVIINNSIMTKKTAGSCIEFLSSSMQICSWLLFDTKQSHSNSPCEALAGMAVWPERSVQHSPYSETPAPCSHQWVLRSLHRWSDCCPKQAQTPVLETSHCHYAVSWGLTIYFDTPAIKFPSTKFSTLIFKVT